MRTRGEYVPSDGISCPMETGRKVSTLEVTHEVSKTLMLDVKSMGNSKN